MEQNIGNSKDEKITKMKDTPEYEYTTYPEGKQSWFYLLFHICFGKRVIQDNEYYDKVCCFQYTTDGKASYGIYVPPDKIYPRDEPELYHPESELCELILCGICLYRRFTKYNDDCKKYGQDQADFIYYTKEKHYNYHKLCSLDYIDY
jgi:hypothetical protein